MFFQAKKKINEKNLNNNTKIMFKNNINWVSEIWVGLKRINKK